MKTEARRQNSHDLDNFSLGHRRFRMQGLTDASIHAGWVQDAFGCQVHAKLSTQKVPKVGDFFYVEVEAPGNVVRFTAWVTNFRDGEIEMALSSEIEVKTGEHDSRIFSEGVSGAVISGKDQMQVSVLDVSEHGLAFISTQQFTVGTMVEFEAAVISGLIRFKGEVRTSRRYDNDPSMFRTGLAVKELDRVSTARWHNFLNQLE